MARGTAKPIALDANELQHYVHLGATKEPLDLGVVDREICNQVGLFFAANLHLADVAIYVQRLVLTPVEGRDVPPRADVILELPGGQRHRLKSTAEGLVPAIPATRPRRPRRRRGRANGSEEDGT